MARESERSTSKIKGILEIVQLCNSSKPSKQMLVINEIQAGKKGLRAGKSSSRVKVLTPEFYKELKM